MKKYIFALTIFLPILSFAAWSQPSATPPLSNTEPPVNVGAVDQIKSGMIGATEFCLYKSDRTTEIGCLGGYDNNFPWVKVNPVTATGAITNTNPGSVGIGTNVPSKKLEVAGGIKATEFCLGSSCITLPDVGGDTINNWKVAIKEILTGSETSCADGQVLEWSSSLSKWVCSSGGGADTLDDVATRGATTGNIIGVGGLVSTGEVLVSSSGDTSL